MRKLLYRLQRRICDRSSFAVNHSAEPKEAFFAKRLRQKTKRREGKSQKKLFDITCYPDFTIRRPTDGRVVLWEHFGLMSDHGYVKAAQEKICTYIAHGFYPMEKLITTFEHEKSTLDFSRVMEIVEWIRVL